MITDNQPSLPPKFSRRARLLGISTIILTLAVGWAGGFFFYTYQNQQEVDQIIKHVINKDEGKDTAVDFSLFWQVWDKLHESYVDQNKLDAQKLVYGAISGMVDAIGDPYTVFFEPVTSKKFQEEVTGEFSGVGMELGKRNNVLTVIAPIKDSPAIKAGVKAGDVVVKIDGKITEGLSVEEAVNLIRGKKGTTVNLTMAREGKSDLLEFSLIRDTIKVPAIDFKILDGHIAYIQIFSFNGNVDAEFELAAQEILRSGADRIIIDLRNNPGGFLDSAVNLGGWLLPSQSLIVKEKFGDGVTKELKASGNARLAKIPLIILINGGSASASEILAGALHDIRDIRLVGEKTFGKGSVQQVESFYNGSSVKITIAKWFTPKDISISDTGIAPTIEVKMDPKEFEEKGWEFGTPGKDPQLDKALEIL